VSPSLWQAYFRAGEKQWLKSRRPAGILSFFFSHKGQIAEIPKTGEFEVGQLNNQE
jgi:hypothetical protein